MKEKSYGVCLYRIVNNEFYILLNRTSSVSELNFFKGKIENNETPKETAIREFKEETNVLLEQKFLEKYFYSYQKRKDIGIYLYQYENIQNPNFNFCEKEIYSANWYKLSMLEDKHFSKNQRKLFNDILLYLKNRFTINYLRT